jgi:formylmethanofuran dehydrogenase subunit E
MGSANTATENVTVSLPGRPVAEKIAHELNAAGADLSRVVLGTYGDETLHLFQSGKHGSLLVERNGKKGLALTRTSYNPMGRTSDYMTIHREHTQFMSSYEAAAHINLVFPVRRTTPAA